MSKAFIFFDYNNSQPLSFLYSPSHSPLLKDFYITCTLCVRYCTQNHGRLVHIITNINCKTRSFSQTNGCRPPERSHMENTGFSYAPAHNVHSSKKGTTAIQMFTLKHSVKLWSFCPDINNLAGAGFIPIHIDVQYSVLHTSQHIYDWLCIHLLFVVHNIFHYAVGYFRCAPYCAFCSGCFFSFRLNFEYYI